MKTKDNNIDYKDNEKLNGNKEIIHEKNNQSNQNKKQKIIIMKLENNIIESINKYKVKTNITIIHPITKYETTFTYKNSGKNAFYFQCNIL